MYTVINLNSWMMGCDMQRYDTIPRSILAPGKYEPPGYAQPTEKYLISLAFQGFSELSSSDAELGKIIGISILLLVSLVNPIFISILQYLFTLTLRFCS